MSAQRDVFLTELLTFARKDKSIILLSADMGAPALDIWRKDLPEQVYQTGIAEQSTINIAAGLASRGFKVYVYTMGSWAARCFEQMRYSCAMAKNPITFLANGVAFGYVPSGPAHESTEDIAYMRSLIGVEIISPANNNMIKPLVELTVKNPAFRYIRMERNYDKVLDQFYPTATPRFVDNGFGIVNKGSNFCIVSSGYMLARALRVKELLKEAKAIDLGIIDLWKIKPIDTNTFSHVFSEYSHIVTLEEQTLSGGFGSAVCEMICDLGMKQKILRLGLPERYVFDNGTREEVIDMCGLSVDKIYSQVTSFIQK